eukprot:3281361-Alexandrium_andersonii.AAC.1
MGAAITSGAPARVCDVQCSAIAISDVLVRVVFGACKPDPMQWTRAVCRDLLLCGGPSRCQLVAGPSCTIDAGLFSPWRVGA